MNTNAKQGLLVEAARISAVKANRLENTTVALVAVACLVPWVAVSVAVGFGAAYAFVRAKWARRHEKQFLTKIDREASDA